MKAAPQPGIRRITGRAEAARRRVRSRTRRLAALSLGALLVTAGLAPSAEAATPRLDRKELQRTLDEISAGGIVGAYSAVQDGRQHWRGATGLADLERKRPTRPDMYHRIGSITKTFVAVAVLQQVDRGRIRLDDPVEKYLPGLLPDRRITVRMLLNHTSHLGDYDEALLTGPDSLEELRTRHFTDHELVRIGIEVGPTGEPGATPGSYSNTNYIVLGLLLDKVTRMPAEQYITRHVIEQSSGNPQFDAALESAIAKASPLPPPPDHLLRQFANGFPVRFRY